MPTYNFRHRETGEITEVSMPMAEREPYLEAHPELEQIITKVNIGDPIRMGVTKPHPGLTDALKGMKRAHKGSTIDV